MSRVEIGSCFRRGGGTWIVKWRRIGERAWRQHRVRDALDELDARARAAADLCAESLPVASTFGAWFSASYLPGLPIAESTRKLYGSYWRTWCRTLAPLRWDELTSARIDAWARALKKAPKIGKGHRGTLSPRYVRAVFALVSSALESAAAVDLLAKNPARQVRKTLPRAVPVRKRPFALTPEEVARLLGCPRIPLGARTLYALSFYACLRPGEARALSWGLVDLVRETIRIERSSRSRKEIGPTKNRRAKTIPLHPEVVETLARWRAAWRLRYGKTPAASDFVFPGRAGASSVRAPNIAGFLAHCRAAGVREIVPHGLRHSGARAYRSAGVSLDDCRVILGHAPSEDEAPGGSVTEHYARPSTEHLRSEMARFSLPECVTRRELDSATAARVLLTSMPTTANDSQDRAEVEEGPREALAQSATFSNSPAPSPQSSPTSSAAAPRNSAPPTSAPDMVQPDPMVGLFADLSDEEFAAVRPRPAAAVRDTPWRRTLVLCPRGWAEPNDEQRAGKHLAATTLRLDPDQPGTNVAHALQIFRDAGIGARFVEPDDEPAARVNEKRDHALAALAAELAAECDADPTNHASMCRAVEAGIATMRAARALANADPYFAAAVASFRGQK